MSQSLDLAPLECRTIPQLLSRSCQFGLQRPWIIESSSGRVMLYREFLERTANTAQILNRRFAQGSRIAVMLSNHAEFFIVRFAIACAGLVEVSLNGEQKGDVLKGMLETATPTAFIVDSQYVDNLTGCGYNLDASELIIGDDLLALCAESAPWDTRPKVHIKPSDTCRILFTSGTTGVSKGVVLSHAYEVFVGHRWGAVLALTPADRYLYATPLFHADAQGLVSAFLHHGTACILMERFSASQFWPVATRYEATCFMYVGTILAILNRGEPPPKDHKIRIGFGAGCSAALWEEWVERTGIPILEGFGMSEGLAVTFTDRNQPVTGSCGRVLPGMEVAIVDSLDRKVNPRIRGEIVFRAHEPFAMMDGYLNNPEATLERFRNLWFHSGDLGSMDEDGNLYFHGRIKDSVRVKGENVSSEELQQIVDAHPDVVISAAVPTPSDLGEEDILLYVQTKPNLTLDPEALCTFIADRAVSFMVPRYIRLVDTLPVSVSEKVSKTTLSREPDSNTWERKQVQR